MSRFERFETRDIPRHEIKGAPYNPRRIGDEARKRLRANLKRVGLLQPLVWNQRTGNLVSGHQRLAILDALERVPDYLLTVAVVDLDPQVEREQNVFLNNPSAMGDWDMDRLKALAKEVDLANLGFEPEALEELFGLPDLTSAEQMPEEMSDEFLLIVFQDADEAGRFAEGLGLDPGDRFVDGPRLAAILEERPVKEAT